MEPETLDAIEARLLDHADGRMGYLKDYGFTLVEGVPALAYVSKDRDRHSMIDDALAVVEEVRRLRDRVEELEARLMGIGGEGGRPS